jgi:hypothetical protein
MKKFVIVLTICCFSLAITAMTPKPALAADDPTVPIVIGTVLGLGAIIGLLLASNASGEQSMKDYYNPKLNAWTYDNMVLEKGQPTEISAFNGGTLAQYYTARTVSVGNTTYHKGGFLTEASSDTESINETRYYGQRYWFYFDKDKKLTGWFCSQMTDKGDGAIWHAYGGDVSFYNGFKSANSKQDAAIPAQRLISAPGSSPAAPAAVPSSSGKTLEQKLKELKDLKDKKLITDEDYKTSKAKLLENAVK